MRIFLNEYYEKKPERLHERTSETLFTLEETDVNNYEFMPMEEHEKEIQKRDELLEQAKVIIESHQAVTRNPFKWESCEQWIKSYEELIK